VRVGSLLRPIGFNRDPQSKTLSFAMIELSVPPNPLSRSAFT